MQPENPLLDGRTWDRVAWFMVNTASQYAIRGELKPPIVVTLFDTESVIFQFILPDLSGRVELGELCPVRAIERPVRFPLEVRYADEHSEFGSTIDLPAPVTVQ